jgi:hypothetical protein
LQLANVSVVLPFVCAQEGVDWASGLFTRGTASIVYYQIQVLINSMLAAHCSHNEPASGPGALTADIPVPG